MKMIKIKYFLVVLSGILYCLQKTWTLPVMLFAEV